MHHKFVLSFHEQCAAMDNAETRPYKTSARLLDQGICLCDKCGKPADIDYKFCTACNETILILKK